VKNKHEHNKAEFPNQPHNKDMSNVVSLTEYRNKILASALTKQINNTLTVLTTSKLSLSDRNYLEHELANARIDLQLLDEDLESGASQW
jgi:hypothetical protein